jgi:hypothetical protein
VALVRTEVSEESIASIIRVERISKPGTTSAVTINWSTLLLRSLLQLLATEDVVLSSPILSTMMMEAIRSSEKSVPTRAT